MYSRVPQRVPEPQRNDGIYDRKRESPSPLRSGIAVFSPAAPKNAIPCESGEGNIQNPRYFTHKISTQTRRSSHKHSFLLSKRISRFTTLARNDHFWSGVCPEPCILQCKTTFAFTSLARNCLFRSSWIENGHSIR